MAHPFEKMFEEALKKSQFDENFVEKEARELIEKGYRHVEVCEVLEKLEKSLIDDTEATIVREAREEICSDLDDDSDEEG